MATWLTSASQRASSRAVEQRARRQRSAPHRKWITGAPVEVDDPSQFLGLDTAITVPYRELGDFLRLRERRGAEVENFLHTHLSDAGTRTSLIWSIRRDYVEALNPGMDAVAVLQKVNNSRWINKYFRAVNSRLRIGGVFAGCVEDNEQRRQRVLQKFPRMIADLYYGMDFVVHRLCPKMPVLKRAYFAITRGHNRPLSAAEALGRLISCGFEIIDYRAIDGLTYFAVRKRTEAFALSAATYGPVCALTRIGKDRKEVKVFKLRTMHPYSEFLQEYLFTRNGTQNGDKITDDFRVAAWAGFMRRIWLDELPMIINLLKGDLKLVGVRPLSRHKFSTYPVDLQALRTRFKPGLIPPSYADMPKTPEEFFQSEERYLLAYAKAPLATDIKYFFAAAWNILIKRARSA